MTRWITFLSAACATAALASSAAWAEDNDDGPADIAPHTNVAIGYVRGQGLGNVGLAAAYTLGAVEVGGAIFAQFGDDQYGAAFAPTLRLNFAHIGRATATTHASTLYLEASPQLVLPAVTSFAEKAWGLSATFGYELRFPNRIGVHFGLGLHARTAVHLRHDSLTVQQPGEFGPHLDAGLRYRF